MEQRCNLWNIWLTWVGMPLLAVVVSFRLGLAAGIFVLAVGILGQLAYIRWFPGLSRLLGYGSVTDQPAIIGVVPTALRPVTLYTANLCPFCPIIRRRLVELRRTMPFELEEIDVTLRPDLIRAKGLRSVPVIEVDGRFLVGNATSRQLADFLTMTPIST